MNEIIFLWMAVGLIVFSFWMLFKAGKSQNQNQEQNQEASWSLNEAASAEKPKVINDDATPFLSAMVDDRTPALVKVEAAALPSISQALKKTEENIWGRIKNIFNANSSHQNFLDEVEEILYTSDLGPQTVERLMTQLRQKMKKNELSDLAAIKSCLKEEMTQIFKVGKAQDRGHSLLESIPLLFNKNKTGPLVIMIVGVNGVGKTTTIGKLSALFAQNNRKVLVAAGDTFRAAAEKQLKAWTDRAQVEIFSPEGTKDPSAVAFDAISKAQAKSYDVVIVDTAGRLHNQAHLMEELKKMKRVMTKIIPESPHYAWIVLDANNGQNALVQAREFHKAINLDGVILTKLDGTAKGGVALSIVEELGLPIEFIGIGESLTDLQVFNPDEFVAAIL